MNKLIILIAVALCAASLPQAPASNVDSDTTVATVDGSIHVGARQVILVFSSDFAGTVGGVSYTWAAGGTLNLGPFPYDTLIAKAYTISAGNIKIIRVQ